MQDLSFLNAAKGDLRVGVHVTCQNSYPITLQTRG